jgi:uncharacterized membrane protein HdeD (DUF308 family)
VSDHLPGLDFGRHGEEGGSDMPTPQAIRRDDAVSLARGDRAPWWAALIAGIALFILGLVIFMLPRQTLTLIVQFVGWFWLVDGVVGLACILADRSDWGWKLLAGMLGVVGGIFVIQYPLWETALVPLLSNLIIGILGIFIGLIQLLLATRGSGWRTGVTGVISVSIGILLAFVPIVGVVLLPFALAGLVMVGGVGTIVASFKRRSAERAERAYLRHA